MNGIAMRSVVISITLSYHFLRKSSESIDRLVNVVKTNNDTARLPHLAIKVKSTRVTHNLASRYIIIIYIKLILSRVTDIQLKYLTS